MGIHRLVRVFPRFPYLVLAVQGAPERKDVPNILDGLFCGFPDDLSDLRCTCGELKFIVNPTQDHVVTVPAVFESKVSLEYQVDTAHPGGTDNRTGTLQQGIQGCMDLADVETTTIEATEVLRSFQ